MTCENLGLIPANDKFLSLGYYGLKLFGVSRLRQRNKNVGRHTTNLICLDKLRLEHKMQDLKHHFIRQICGKPTMSPNSIEKHGSIFIEGHQ